MSIKPLSLAAAAVVLAVPPFAGITIEDAYARTASPAAKSGAVFMTILNDGDAADRLVAASSDSAAKVALHRHVDAGNGVMKMNEAAGGFVIPAGGRHALARGGDHVMFMGLTGPWADGDVVHVILTFEKAGPMAVDVPVDQTR